MDPGTELCMSVHFWEVYPTKKMVLRKEEEAFN